MLTPSLILFSNSFAPNIKNIFSESSIKEINLKNDRCNNAYANRLHYVAEYFESKTFSNVTIIENNIDKGLLLSKLNGTYDVICRFVDEKSLNMSFNLFDALLHYADLKDEFKLDGLFVEDDAETFFDKDLLDDLNESVSKIQNILDMATEENENLYVKLKKIYEEKIKV
jgi:predicted NodU family carbamoyl transferase